MIDTSRVKSTLNRVIEDLQPYLELPMNLQVGFRS